MRFVTVHNGAQTLLASETPRYIIPLEKAFQLIAGLSSPNDAVSFIAMGRKTLEKARDLVDHCLSASSREKTHMKRNGLLLDPAKVRRLAPLRPRAILCSGHNYVGHREEKPPVPVENPEFFLKLPDLVIGPGDTVMLDHRVTKKLDHETELAVVIGRRGRHIQSSRALDYVFGYTIMNDVSARDQQIRKASSGGFDYFLGPGKNFDTAAPIGPAIVTTAEIPDPQALRVRSWVNGEARQDASTSQMIWGVRELVAYFSKFVTLHPGYVIATGTPGRTAWGWDRELGGKRAAETVGRPRRLYLDDGDLVRCEIERIGVLENPVRRAGLRGGS
jgi:2-keto-4-pentenoate hydratase/2-oxohepta-3-ene-1,7-dioic acid hydratase in catechol pathway